MATWKYFDLNKTYVLVNLGKETGLCNLYGT